MKGRAVPLQGPFLPLFFQTFYELVKLHHAARPVNCITEMHLQESLPTLRCTWCCMLLMLMCIVDSNHALREAAPSSTLHSGAAEKHGSATSGTVFTMQRQRIFNRTALINSHEIQAHTVNGDELNCSMWAVVTTINNASRNFDLLATGLGSLWCLVVVLDTTTTQPFAFFSPRAVVLTP